MYGLSGLHKTFKRTQDYTLENSLAKQESNNNNELQIIYLSYGTFFLLWNKLHFYLNDQPAHSSVFQAMILNTSWIAILMLQTIQKLFILHKRGKTIFV